MRLGEHDTRIDVDHVDALVSHVDAHADYLIELLINDIAIVYLVNDVHFTGALILRSFCKFLKLF